VIRRFSILILNTYIHPSSGGFTRLAKCIFRFFARMFNALIGTWQPPIWLRWSFNKTTEAMHPTIFPQKSTFIEHQFFHLTRRWRQVGRPRRVSPTFLSSVQNLHLTFASVRVIRGSISSSRRWRQVGRPRRVSPTVLSVEVTVAPLLIVRQLPLLTLPTWSAPAMSLLPGSVTRAQLFEEVVSTTEFF